jgi:hypothetical protein
MRIAHTIWLLPSLALAACGQAAAATVDPAKDLDCAVAASYFSALAEHTNAPAHQQHAAHVVNQWFLAKWRAGNPGARIPEAESEPILAAIDANPRNYTEAMRSCAYRATSDPKFDSFERTIR